MVQRSHGTVYHGKIKRTKIVRCTPKSPPTGAWRAQTAPHQLQKGRVGKNSCGGVKLESAKSKARSSTNLTGGLGKVLILRDTKSSMELVRKICAWHILGKRLGLNWRHQRANTWGDCRVAGEETLWLVLEKNISRTKPDIRKKLAGRGEHKVIMSWKSALIME